MTAQIIALRNITRQKKRTFLLGGAIAFGILVITVINGLTSGMVKNVKDNFSHLLAGHIFIQGTEITESGKTVSVIRDDTLLRDIIRDLDVDDKYLTKRSSTISTLIFGSKELMQRIDGVAWSEESYFKERLVLKEGNIDDIAEPNALILSSSAAQKLGIHVGETLLARVRTLTGQQNVGEFRVIALTQSTDIMGELSSYVHLDYLNSLINLKNGEFMSFNIYLEDMEKMDMEANKIFEMLSEKAQVYPREVEQEQTEDDEPPMHGMFGMFAADDVEEPWEGTKYKLITLNDIMSQVMSMVNVLNVIGFIVFLILLLITMVGITNTFRMILIERTREIGTMRAIGMQKSGVRNIFFMEAIYIGLIGSFAGIILAFIVIAVLSFINFGLDNPLFIFLNNGKLTLNVSFLNIISYIFIIGTISLLAAFFPAERAATLDPAKALGTHY